MWFARAQVLAIRGRGAEAAEAARRSRDLCSTKGWVSGMRRADALLTSVSG